MPGLTKLTIRETPLLALYEASQCYLKSLDTLVREVAHGKVQPDDLDGYLTSSPTLASSRSHESSRLADTSVGTSSRRMPAESVAANPAHLSLTAAHCPRVR